MTEPHSAASTDNLVIVLVGPKGSGKSHIGAVISEIFGLPFLRVESIWQSVRLEKPEYAAANYLSCREYVDRVMNACFSAVQQILSKHRSVIIETTGVFSFDSYLRQLKTVARVILVKVQADPASCLSRIRKRDQSLQIPVSETDIADINKRSAALNYSWQISLNNDPFLSADEIKNAFIDFLASARPA